MLDKDLDSIDKLLRPKHYYSKESKKDFKRNHKNLIVKSDYLKWEQKLQNPFILINEKYLWSIGEDLYRRNIAARGRLIMNVCAALLERAPANNSAFCDEEMSTYTR